MAGAKTSETGRNAIHVPLFKQLPLSPIEARPSASIAPYAGGACPTPEPYFRKAKRSARLIHSRRSLSGKSVPRHDGATVSPCLGLRSRFSLPSLDVSADARREGTGAFALPVFRMRVAGPGLKRKQCGSAASTALSLVDGARESGARSATPVPRVIVEE